MADPDFAAADAGARQEIGPESSENLKEVRSLPVALHFATSTLLHVRSPKPAATHVQCTTHYSYSPPRHPLPLPAQRSDRPVHQPLFFLAFQFRQRAGLLALPASDLSSAPHPLPSSPRALCPSG